MKWIKKKEADLFCEPDVLVRSTIYTHINALQSTVSYIMYEYEFAFACLYLVS